MIETFGILRSNYFSNLFDLCTIYSLSIFYNDFLGNTQYRLLFFVRSTYFFPNLSKIQQLVLSDIQRFTLQVVVLCQINIFCYQITQNSTTGFVRFTKICTWKMLFLRKKIVLPLLCLMNKSIVVDSMIGLSLRKKLLGGPAKVDLTTSHLNLKVNVK